ncbi:MAG: type III-B CRISPR module RAMP protein Cmr4 [Oscillatoriales cyanobacterium]|uniref:Type III-B CRISPR module RAMP protein Cmr4 n=1 Tax=Microcoleus anatoxicus PTRS2 TaxID=2705321 RepID=A0ABU8YPX0_9CYAN|nr:MAG: type III-B CRISPR module RAMP protein Cmr4 [Oscillatoriales cyanobacterium]TAF66554.1 MAG: type III-B CRISPR module RAMP protein Cmr4 [Oscillatoriales cyanobacterium]
MINYVYLYLLSPLHTGGTTQEGNLLGIARESHTNLPYIPSSSIRGKVRSSVANRVTRVQLFGPELKDTQDPDFVFEYEYETDKKLNQLEQGSIWIGDASILWLPVPSLSHGIVWISCPLLLQRWARFNSGDIHIEEYSSNLPKKSSVYLKDAIIKGERLKPFANWQDFIPQKDSSIKRVLVLPDQHCATLIQMSLWRQVKVKLDEHKVVDGGFRYEEAIPPDTLMYFPWGITSQANGTAKQSRDEFEKILAAQPVLQIGGQESLGRGFVQQWTITK